MIENRETNRRDIKRNIKRVCSINNQVVSLIVCELCNYYGGEDSLFTRYSCLHPKTQEIINESIRKAKELYGL